MSKQRLEGDFRDGIKDSDRLWYIKLQTLPLAHTNNPADFIVLSKNHKYLVECKQCTTNAFTFDRLTQKQPLLEFDHLHDNNHSYLLVSFWKGRKSRSFYYLIPIDIFIDFMGFIPKKSANMKDFELYLKQYIVNIDEVHRYFE